MKARDTRPQPVDEKQVRDFFSNARKKLKAAAASPDEEAAHEIAYGAMLKATIAHMLSTGQRLRSGPGHHEAAIAFADSRLGKTYPTIISGFRRMKRKRNQTFYDVVPTTATEAKHAIDLAKEFLDLVEQEIEAELVKLSKGF